MAQINKLRVLLTSSDSFTYCSASRTLVRDMSDFGKASPFCRLYDDAADAGFGIRSSRTGRVVYFRLSGEVRDPEGEIVLWRFLPLASCGIACVEIHND